MESALEIAATRGMQSATVDAISKHSGVAKSTIYRHWDGASAIFVDALEFEAVEHVAIDSGNMRDDSIHFMLNLANVLTQNRSGRILPHLVSSAAVDADYAAVMVQHVANRKAVNNEILARGVERGELPEDVDLFKLQEWLVAPLIHRFLVSGDPLDEQWVIGHVDATLQLVASATSPRM